MPLSLRGHVPAPAGRLSVYSAVPSVRLGEIACLALRALLSGVDDLIVMGAVCHSIQAGVSGRGYEWSGLLCGWSPKEGRVFVVDFFAFDCVVD